MVGLTNPLLARVRNQWRRHHNRMNPPRTRTPRASQHETGWKVPQRPPLLPVAGEFFLLTFPSYRTVFSFSGISGRASCREQNLSDGMGVLTMMPNRRQSVSAHAGERLPALASRVNVLSHF
jgi:hypothetical protein